MQLKVNSLDHPTAPRSRDIPIARFVADALVDFERSMRRFNLAWFLAWKEISSNIRLTALGPLWLIIQPLLWMLTIVIFYGPSLGRGYPDYPLYVALGITVYSGISLLITDGARTFTSSSSIFINIPLPISLCIFKTVCKALLQLLIASPIPIVTAMFYQPDWGPGVLLAIPGLLIFVVFGLGASMLFGVVATRYRDATFALAAVMRVMMFATPVFWLPEYRHGLRLVLTHYNPLYYLLLVIREPLMGHVPPLGSFLISGGIAVLMFVIGAAVFARFRNRIALWM